MHKRNMSKTQEKSKPSKPANTGEKQVLTGRERTQFKPGQSGNPAGKKPGTYGITTLLKMLLKEIPENGDKSYAELVAKRLILNAMSGKEKSIGMLLDRSDGKVAEEWKGEVEHTGVVGSIELKGKDNKAVVDMWKQFLRSQVKKRNAARTDEE